MAYRPTWQGHLKLSLVTCRRCRAGGIAPERCVPFVSPVREHLIQHLQETLAHDVWKGRADRLAGPACAIEQPAMLTVDELDDMLRPTHDTDEAGRLLLRGFRCN